MAKYKNIVPSTVISVASKDGIVRLPYGEVVDVPADANVEVYVKRGKVEKVDSKPTKEKPAEPTPTATNS